MERRQFLQVTAAGALGISLSGAAGLTSADPSLSYLARPELLGMLDRRSVTDIGLAYRAAFRDENTADKLTSALRSDARLSVSAGTAELHRRLEEQIRADFASRRTIQLNGWVLSVTEARQCALYSIVSL